MMKARPLNKTGVAFLPFNIVLSTKATAEFLVEQNFHCSFFSV